MKRSLRRPISRDGRALLPLVNRLLSISSAIPAAVVERIKERRVTGLSMGDFVRISTRSGTHFDFVLTDGAQGLLPRLPVYVWWSVGGMVCAPVSEVDAEEAHARSVVRKVQEARAALARARELRSLQTQGPAASPDIDILL